MGVSFKISKTGTRFTPKLLRIEGSGNENDGSVAEAQQITAEGNYTTIGGNVADHANVMVNSGLYSALKDLEASFSLNLFPDGFSVGKITEVFNDLPKQLHPYDRASKTLFSAIEYGWLPGEILDELPCKYINGAVLCEVHDYRKCLFSKVDNASTENSPIVHKVMLQMCMENVVKDLLSLTDDSWTYGDLLEAESYILKALQPDLHLNPQLTLDRNPPTKKLDLGITWSWKKREPNPPPATNLDFNMCNVTSILGTSGVQSSNLESFQTDQASGVSSLEHLNSSTTSLCNPLTSDTTCQITDSYNQPVTNLLTDPTNLVSVPRQVGNSSDPRKVSFTGVGGSTGCITQAIEGHILKKPKTEPVEFDLDSEFQWRKDMLQQQAVVDKFQYERTLVKSGLLLSQGNDQQVLKVLPKLLYGMPLSVKQEPVEASNLASSEVGNQLDPYLGTKSRKNSGAQKRKALVNPQVSIGARNESSSYCNNGVMQRQASRPGKRAKKNSGPKGCEVIDSLDYRSNYNAANLISLPFCNRPLRQLSTLKCEPDSLFERFVKVKMMTQRHGLNKQKCKLDRPLQEKSVFNTAPLIALHFSNCDDNQNLEQTRAFTFVRPGDSEIAYETRVKLVISEKLNERMAETCVLYYQPRKETESIGVPITPSFPSTLFTDLFAAQFISLMVREGYSLGSDQREPTLLISDDNPNNHGQSVPSSDIPQVKIVDQHLPTLTSRPSPVMQSSTDMSTSLANHLSQDIWSGRFLLPPGSTMQSVNPIMKSPNPLSKPQVDIAVRGKSLQSFNPLSRSQLSNISSKGNSVQPQNPVPKFELDLAGKGYSKPLSKSKLGIDVKGNPMQSYNPLSKSQLDIDKGNHMQILKRHALSQVFQMQQRQRQVEQIMWHKAEEGRLGLAACGPGFSGGTQGLGNTSLASLSSLMGTGGSMPSCMGGQIPWIGNLGHLNNLSDNLLSSNESKQVGEAMSSLLQSPQAGFLLEHIVSSPPSQGSLQQLDQQSGTSSQQLFPGFPYQELSSQTHGSAGSSSNASSNKLQGQ